MWRRKKRRRNKIKIDLPSGKEEVEEEVEEYKGRSTVGRGA